MPGRFPKKLGPKRLGRERVCNNEGASEGRSDRNSSMFGRFPAKASRKRLGREVASGGRESDRKSSVFGRSPSKHGDRF